MQPNKPWIMRLAGPKAAAGGIPSVSSSTGLAAVPAAPASLTHKNLKRMHANELGSAATSSKYSITARSDYMSDESSDVANDQDSDMLTSVVKQGKGRKKFSDQQLRKLSDIRAHGKEGLVCAVCGASFMSQSPFPGGEEHYGNYYPWAKLHLG